MLHYFLNTQYVSYHTSQPFPFHLEAQTRRYSCYHTRTAFIDTTSSTAWGTFAFAQTADHLLLSLMKSPQREQKPRSGVRRGGFALSASDLLHRFMEERKGSQDTSIDLAPPPTSLFPLYLPSNHPPAQKGRTGVLILAESVHVCCVCVRLYVCVCAFLRAAKADTMNPGNCLRGFISHCVSRCLGDGRKLFMGLKMLEWAGEMFFSTTTVCMCVCVSPSRNLWWRLIFFLIVSNYISLRLLCSPTALVPVCDLKVPRIA